MAMCYLCDLCAQPHRISKDGNLMCGKRRSRLRRFAIDYGRDDPHEICKHFEPKEGE